MSTTRCELDAVESHLHWSRDTSDWTWQLAASCRAHFIQRAPVSPSLIVQFVSDSCRVWDGAHVVLQCQPSGRQESARRFLQMSRRVKRPNLDSCPSPNSVGVRDWASCWASLVSFQICAPVGLDSLKKLKSLDETNILCFIRQLYSQVCVALLQRYRDQ